MAGLTVLLGSNFGIPLSTTHCKVGAVVSVSLMHNRKAVSWRTFGNIAWAWIVTLPVSGNFSKLTMIPLRSTAYVSLDQFKHGRNFE